MNPAFQDRVHEIEDESGRKDTKKPLPASDEKIFIAGILIDFIREKESAKKKENNGIDNQKEINLERPFPDAGEPKFPPPEMHEHQQHKHGPSKMDKINLLPSRVLYEIS